MDHFTPANDPQQVVLAPLSFGQQAIWYMNQIEREKPVYNSPFGLFFEGNLNYHALDEAVNQLVKRQEILRTRFIEVNGQPMQEVLPFTHQSIPVQNLHLKEGESLKQTLTGWYTVNGTRHQLDQRTAHIAHERAKSGHTPHLAARNDISYD